MSDLPHDPIEDDPAFRADLDAAAEAARLELIDHPMNGQNGFCHVFWASKKRILKERFGIDWRTPVEMDPYRLTMFD